MTDLLRFVAVAVIIAATMLLGALFVITTYTAESSVTFGNDYNSTVATSTVTGTSTLEQRSGSLGSVVVTSIGTSARYIGFYDTTATSAATTTLPLIAEVHGSAAEGTYTFDISTGRGLLMDVPPDFDGSVTITHR